MPHVNINIHFVWSTKYRVPHLNSKEIREKVWFHIKENAEKKGIYVDHINGHEDHCHCLVSLGIDQTIKWVAQMLKGESSRWINKEGITQSKFEWQDSYFAVSVSKSIVPKVRNYISNQEEHHKKKSFKDEVDELVKKFGFIMYKDE